jgi:hypothetical protein
MKKYFLHNETGQQGPFDIDDLKAKNITRETPIWFDGISEWTTAGKVEELQSLFPTLPPPFLITSFTPPIKKTEEKQIETFHQPEIGKNKFGFYALIISGIIVLIIGLTYLLKKNLIGFESNTSKLENINKDKSVNSTIKIPQQQIVKTPIIVNKNSLKDKLIGDHNFGVQFIWDKYGTASISNNGTNLIINGTQFSNDNTEYCKINGELEVINDKTLNFTGNITIFTKNCCGLIDINGNFTFSKTGNRKYWRLQERNKLCDEYTCCYYLDIFQ